MRSFIGSPIENSEEFSELLESLSFHREINPVSMNNIHLTYLFLSDINDSQKNIAIKRLQQLKFKALTCRVNSLKTLPERSTPRVIVVVLDCPELSDISDALNETFSLNINHTQSFLPHITVGRYRKHSNPILLESIKLDICTVKLRRICLYKSTLTERGSIYEKIYCKEPV